MDVRAEVVTWMRSRLGSRVPSDPLPDDVAVFGRNGLLDSLTVLELVVFIEKKFGIEVAAHQVNADEIGTLGALVRFVDSRRRRP